MIERRKIKVEWNNIDAVVISAFYKEDEIFDELKSKYLYDKTILRLNDTNQENKLRFIYNGDSESG